MLEPAIDSPPVTCKQRKYQKLDKRRARELAEKGLGSTTIGQLLNVAPSTVWRFLQSTSLEQQAVKEYVSNRAQTFQYLQGKTLDIQHKIIERLNNGLLDAMQPQQICNLLHSMNTVFGTIYDKERLEQGKSTSNVSLIGRMMGEAVKTAHENKDLEKE